MKILAGELHETVYNSPKNGGDDAKSMTIKSSRTFRTNEVTYISDDIGVHRVHNPRSDRVAVSLHCKFLNIQILLQLTDCIKCTRPLTQPITVITSLTNLLDTPHMCLKRTQFKKKEKKKHLSVHRLTHSLPCNSYERILE